MLPIPLCLTSSDENVWFVSDAVSLGAQSFALQGTKSRKAFTKRRNMEESWIQQLSDFDQQCKAWTTPENARHRRGNTDDQRFPQDASFLRNFLFSSNKKENNSFPFAEGRPHREMLSFARKILQTDRIRSPFSRKNRGGKLTTLRDAADGGTRDDAYAWKLVSADVQWLWQVKWVLMRAKCD